ncbi:hypothetical protein C1752_01027 [Acaryochloris thomasi RCC1774]|uniref:Uncharacterized protein n=1 Tax=Acaryochloris thomasi RCC1774 TaxID=1764569 RepID=A0A2W1JNL6_9CYAN|nr:hypothetical protein C1752_01027 [Acaryochloris thomasi RCC1774]
MMPNLMFWQKGGLWLLHNRRQDPGPNTTGVDLEFNIDEDPFSTLSGLSKIQLCKVSNYLGVGESLTKEFQAQSIIRTVLRSR